MFIQFDSHGYPKVYNNPRYLFRYVRADQRLISALKEHYLWYSTPPDLNDPFDCQWLLDSNNNKVELFQFLSQFSGGSRFDRKQRKILASELARDKKRLASLHIDGFRNFTAKLGICCFSECNDDPLMWAHYANGHRGVCMVFHFSKLQSESNGIPMKVAYSSSPPKFNLVRERIKRGSTPLFNYNFQQAVLATKSNDWAYEKEVRLISGRHGKVAFAPHALIGVIFGGKVDPNIKQEITEAVLDNNHDAQFGNAKIDASTGRILVDGFVNQIEEGVVSRFLERDGHLDARPSISMVRYKKATD